MMIMTGTPNTSEMRKERRQLNEITFSRAFLYGNSPINLALMIEAGATIVSVMWLRFVWAELLNGFDNGTNADEG